MELGNKDKGLEVIEKIKDEKEKLKDNNKEEEKIDNKVE